MAAVPSRVQLRRDTAANWTSNNPTLAAGEAGYETDTGKLKLGTGSAQWSALAYFGGAASLVDNGDGTYTWSPATGPGFTFGGVSSDAGNLLTLGADDKPMLDPAALPQPATAAPANNAQAAAVGASALYARADHVHKEALTALSYNAVTTELSYLDEAGNTAVINLSALTTDIYVTGASLNATTGVLTLTDASGTTPDVTVNLGALTGSLVDNANGTFTYTTPSGSVTFNAKLGVSSAVGNSLSVGADGLPFYQAPTLSSAAPQALGTAAAGSSADVARADHVHAMPAFKELTGTPANPAAISLVGVNTSGDVVFYDGIDGGNASGV